MILSSKLYEILKWTALIFLPAVSTIYLALSSIWGWPYATQVAQTIAAIETFIGALIGISNKNHYDKVVEEALLAEEKQGKE